MPSLIFSIYIANYCNIFAVEIKNVSHNYTYPENYCDCSNIIAPYLFGTICIYCNHDNLQNLSTFTLDIYYPFITKQNMLTFVGHSWYIKIGLYLRGIAGRTQVYQITLQNLIKWQQ